MLRPVKKWLSILSLAVMAAMLPTMAKADEEFDSAKWKLQLNGWVSQPAGYFNGASGNGYFDLQKDFGFGNYATFSGRLDWRFKRKHHLTFGVNPVLSSQTTTLTRTIDWQGQTYDIGARVNADIKSLFFSVGYHYDFFRKKQGWLGVVALKHGGYRSHLEGHRERVRRRHGEGTVERLAIRTSTCDRTRFQMVSDTGQWPVLSRGSVHGNVVLRIRQFHFGECGGGISVRKALGCAGRVLVGQPAEDQQLEQQYFAAARTKRTAVWRGVSLGPALAGVY